MQMQGRGKASREGGTYFHFKDVEGLQRGLILKLHIYSYERGIVYNVLDKEESALFVDARK
jgi:hypothetical protein